MAEGGGIETVYLHTATHLLQAALRRVLGDEVKQKGSNITPERLRFDFSFGRPMTKEEIEKTEALVNQAIEQNLPVTCEEMPVEDARKRRDRAFRRQIRRGGKGVFYGRFQQGDMRRPHAASTGELGKFVITKEQSSSAGVGA